MSRQLQRQSSFSSAVSGLSGSEAGSTAGSAQGGENGEGTQGQEGGDTSAELLTQQGSLQEAVFGVLYTLSKERLTEGWRFVVFAMVLDYLQLAVFFIGNNFPWNFNFSAWYWKWLSWVCFTNMFPQGTGLINGNYNLYLAIFFVLTGFLLASAALCVFVGINFKRNQFPYVWPIKVLKLTVSFFFELFYISTLGIFIVALDCTYYNAVKVNEKFRSEKCFQMPHLVVIAISVATSLLAMAMAYFIAVANSELDPLSEELNSQAHNRSALKRYALISLITIINEVFPSYTKIQGIACIIIMTYLCYNYVRCIPFQVAWVNGLQASFFASLSWASLLIILMAFFYPSSNKQTFTVLVWVGLLWVVPLVWALVYLRVRHTHKVALLYRMALKSDSAPVTHKFVDEREVEIVARCGRIRDKYGDLMPAWVDTAEAVYKAGLAQFPHSSYLHIAYSSFLISRGAAQAGAGLLEVARKLDPSIGERFMIFVRDREQKQRGGSGADGSSHDLLSYVEFQTNFNALMDVHRHALKANRSFWRQLVRKDIAFNDLTRAFATMEAAEKRADSTFDMVLQRYPSNPKLLYAYALYLESVKSNPAHAARYRAEATRLEKAAPQVAKSALIEGFEGGGDSEGGGDRSMGAMMSDSNDAVVVINDAGIIQFVNKKLLEMFGYKQGQLQGKNVSVLAPPPFSNHHSQYLQRLKKTGKATLLGKPAVRRVALHAQGFSFPVTLAIKELQQGDAKSFVGVFKPVVEHSHVTMLWVNSAGNILGLNKGFTDAFGYCLADLRGELAGSIGTDDNLGMEFRHISQQLDTWQYSAAEVGTTMHTFKVSLKHKYGAALTVSGSASFEGTENVRLVVLKFALDEGVEKLGLISMTGPGQIVYVNEVLEKMLGYEPGFLVDKKKSTRDIMRSPYGLLHLRWMQQAAQSAENHTMVPSSCCTGRIVVLLSRHKDQVPVRLRVVEAEVGNTRCLTASVTEVSVPEADAWGGGDVKELCNSSKRMLLLVHGDGRVLAFKADPATALQGFGQDVAELCGKDISAVVRDFSKPAGLQQDWPSVPQLLSRLSHQTSKAHAAGVAPSFRVDLLPCLIAANQRKQRLKGASADSASATIPCRMVVLPVADADLDVHELVEGGAVSGQDVSDGTRLHVVELRRDDLLEVVLEVDPQLRIKAADSEAPYLFGSHALEGKSLNKFLRLPGSFSIHRSTDMPSSASSWVMALRHCLRCEPAHEACEAYRLGCILQLMLSPRRTGSLTDTPFRVEDLLLVKRTQLKRIDQQSAGEKREMEALHADGSRVRVLVQGADKHGDGTRWVLRVTVQSAQPASQVGPSLLEALSRCEIAPAGSLQSSRSNSPAPQEDFQIAAVPASSSPATPRAQSADGRSERSADDAASNNDGTSLGGSDMAGGHHASDHQRAKRFHRLDKMLSSPKAQQMIRTLKWASIVMVLLLVSVHALFFGLTIKGINDFQQFFDHVVVAGEASTSSSKMISAMRVLVSCTDNTNTFTLRHTDPNQADQYLAEYDAFMSAKASQFEASSRRLVFGSSKKLQVPATAELENLFIGNHDGVSIKELSPTRQYNASLWDLSQRFATAGRLIAATAITPAGAALANSTEVGFLISNRDTVAANVVQTINFQQAVASVKIAQQTKDIIIFLIAEAGGLIPVCCLGLYVLLTLVHRARIKLFSVFLAVPRPVVMQLATREVQVSADADDGDDEESDTWLGQQEQQQGDAGSGAVPGTGVGFNLTASKRTLRTHGLAAYVMMSPFILWGILVCVIYAVSIVKLRGTTAAVANLVASQLLDLYVNVVYNKAVGIAFSSSASEATQLQAVLGAALPKVKLYLEGLLYGNPSLGLDGALRSNNEHEKLWFGQMCLNLNASQCLTPGDPMYEDTHNGLNHLVNMFLLNGYQLQTIRPAVDIGLGTPQFDFLWNVSSEGQPLEDGLMRNTANFVSDGQGQMTVITILQVLTEVVGVLTALYVYFKMLLPFLQHSKRESRRVAELLAQLPAEMNVEYLVLSSTNQEEEDGQHPATQAGLFVSLGRLFGCCGRGRARVSPKPRQPSETAKLNIVVSQNTSKDNEAPTGAARDVSAKYKTYTEKMQRHHSEESDLALTDPRRLSRKVSFSFPTMQ